MKFIYPAVFSRKDDGTYEGYFPDLEHCFAKGETLEDAVEDANEAATTWISLELEEECPLPPVTDVNDIHLAENEVIRNISVNYRFMEGWEE
jgi:predicted RNase H-like HicB family nuclease